jgi:hypothetical protein
MAGKRVLMVEGRDDEYVVTKICDQRQLGFTAEHSGGKDALLKAISVRLKESDIEALGIMLDADTDVLASWQAVKDRLTASGYQHIPDAPDAEGTVIAAPPATLLPRVGVWLMPNNQVPGILEDFLRFLVPADDALWTLADQAVERIPHEEQRFSDLKKPKACLHTWLAWQEEPGKPFGQAILARYLDPTLPAGEMLTSWLRRMFFTP